jgi:hypothetical protein
MRISLQNSFFRLSNARISVRPVITPSGQVVYVVSELLITTGAGTWTKPEGITSVTVECWGGGGGGGGSTTNGNGGGGGAGGAYARKIITYSSPSQSINYTVGAGGTTGTGDAGAGGDSFWNTNEVLAVGGGGGFGGGSVDGGLSGNQALADNCIGDIKYNGGISLYGINANVVGSQILFSAGGGGAGSTGVGGNANGSTEIIADTGGIGTSELGGDGADGNDGTVNFTGLPGSNYGGGGSGAMKISGANRSGGTGAQGLIRVSYTIPPPLDIYTGSLAAFSVRKLSDSASFCMRVRRDSDNATQNIGFQSDGLIDTGSLLTFVGSGTGYVNVWYNQMNNDNNAVTPEGTSIAEPYIVSSGSLMTMNGKPAVFYNALAGLITDGSVLTNNSGLWSTYAVGQVADTTTRLMVRTVSQSVNISQNIRRNTTNIESIGFNTAAGSATDLGPINPETSQFIAYAQRTSTNVEVYVNGATNGATTVTGTPAIGNLGNIHLGFFGGTTTPTFPWSGSIQEVIHFPQDPTTFNYRTALISILNSYYGTF